MANVVMPPNEEEQTTADSVRDLPRVSLLVKCLDTIMNEDEFRSIRNYGEHPGFTLEEQKSAFALSFERDSLSFKVTVAHEVLEWFVEIVDPDSGLKFSDWADYTGYDRRPRNELVEEMTEHLNRLFRALMSRTFRLRKGRRWLRPSDHCEWLNGDKWVEFDYSDT